MKRKLEQLEEEGDLSSCCSSSSSSSSSGCVSIPSGSSSCVSPVWGSDEEGSWLRGPPQEQDVCSPKSFTPLSILKRTPQRRPGRVTFDGGVTVFYFPRCQGFTSVPSRGGCTLGMASRHHTWHRFSLSEFTREQARVRREKLRQRLKEEKLEAQRQQLAAAGMAEGDSNSRPAVDEASLDEAVAVAVAGGRLEHEVFLQPRAARQRRALLRASGVRRIDREEKRELRALRQAREDCGCHCDQTCDPDTCSCSLAGIRCQMDHTAFPCSCSRDGCANPEGRVEFNQARVQTHFVHTLARLQLESMGEMAMPAAGHARASGEQALLAPFLGGGGGSSSSSSSGGDKEEDHSCSSSDMTDCSTASSFSSSMVESQHGSPSPPEPHFQPTPASELWGEEEEEEEGGSRGDPLDHLSDFHLSDVFEAGSPDSLAQWPQNYVGPNLPSGILDENANLDAGGFLLGESGGAAALGDDVPPAGGPPLSNLDTPQSLAAQLSCDSLGWLQTLPDYSLGPHYPSPKISEGLECSPSGDFSHGFLESLLGFSEPGLEATSPFGDNQFENASATPSLVEPVPV